MDGKLPSAGGFHGKSSRVQASSCRCDRRGRCQPDESCSTVTGTVLSWKSAASAEAHRRAAGPLNVLWSAVFPVTIVVLPEYDVVGRMCRFGSAAVVGFSSN